MYARGRGCLYTNSRIIWHDHDLDAETWHGYREGYHDLKAKILRSSMTSREQRLHSMFVLNMASLVLLVACWLLLQLTGSHSQNCPTISSISPPSGTVQVTFTITGSNLDGLQEVVVDIGRNQNANITQSTRNETHLQFRIGGTLLGGGGPRDVMFMINATLSSCQQPAPITLDLRRGILCVLTPVFNVFILA